MCISVFLSCHGFHVLTRGDVEVNEVVNGPSTGNIFPHSMLFVSVQIESFYLTII